MEGEDGVDEGWILLVPTRFYPDFNFRFVDNSFYLVSSASRRSINERHFSPSVISQRSKWVHAPPPLPTSLHPKRPAPRLWKDRVEEHD